MAARKQLADHVALRRGCGAAALLGLLAMHGLGLHGTAHLGHASTAMPMDAAVSAPHEHPRMPDVAASDGSAPQHRILGLAGLCLAVLLLGIVLGTRHGRHLLQGPLHGLRTADRPARARRDRAPPSLLALSIQRC